MGMESNLVADFVCKTAANPTVAHRYLQAKGWDLNQALQLYFQNPALSDNWTVGDLVTNEINFQRPVLQKAEAVDVRDAKKLSRGISRATDNVNLVSRARSDIATDFKENSVCSINQYFIETPVYTFTLPDLTIYSEDFRGFLEKDLIETSSLVSLEQAGRLNWWADSGICQRLWPLATTGDGNCLLHAASLGMWGFHDRLLTLRKALHAFLTCSDYRESLWRRWRWQQTRVNLEVGFVYTEEEWRKEWENIVNMASTEPRKINGGRRRSILFDKNSCEIQENATYEGLEEIHVFALAHVLRRPIIVIADVMLKDVNGDDLAPIQFGGIYLPIECSPEDCHKSPLVLTYDAAHFSALVVMEREKFVDKLPQPPAVIPLTNSEHELLPIQFSVDPGESFVWEKNSAEVCNFLKGPDQMLLLKKYLDVVQIPITSTLCPEEDLNSEESNYINDEDEIEKRYSEFLDTESSELCDSTAEGSLFGNNRSKAAKQLQSVAKQFGSIGKSMSKKLKKNLGSITKITRNNSQKKLSGISSNPVRQTTLLNNHLMSRSQDHILCAVLYTDKRHEYQEEMVRNYLVSARARFEKDKEMKKQQAEERRMKDECISYPAKCLSPGCNGYATSKCNFSCNSCLEKQQTPFTSQVVGDMNIHHEEISAPRYGTGKSQFYTESDMHSHDTISRLPATRAASNIDQTLYLSKSTFYNDTTSLLSRSAKENTKLNSSPISLQRDQTLGSRIHSYNLSEMLDESATSSGKQSDLWSNNIAFNNVDQICNIQGNLPTETEIQRSSAPVHGSQSISVAGLSSQMGYELPTVEHVPNKSQLTGPGALPCRTNNCRYYGNVVCEYYCSKCYKEIQKHCVKSLTVQEVKR